MTVFSDQSRYLAVDLGGTNVRVALADSQGRLVIRDQRLTAVALGPEGVVDQITEMVLGLLRTAAVLPAEITRMGIAAPGPIDRHHGLVLGPPNLPGWDEVPLAAMVKEQLGISAVLANDANAAALGEYTWGAGRDAGTMVYLTVSTGIGGGVVADGRLLAGYGGNACELGHMVIDPHGPRCGCGVRGCLEAFASGTGIARRFGEFVERGENSSLSARIDRTAITAADIAQAARAGDELSLAVVTWAAEALGIGVANFVNIFNPSIVVLGGGVTGVGDLLFDIVRDVVNRYALPALRDVVRIVPSELGDDAGLLGAAVVAIGR